MDKFDERCNQTEAAANVKLAKHQEKEIKQEEVEEKPTIIEKNMTDML